MTDFSLNMSSNVESTMLVRYFNVRTTLAASFLAIIDKNMFQAAVRAWGN